MNNSDLPIRLGILIASHTTAWVEESQPVRWRADAWRRYWHKNGLPCGHVLDELAAEYGSQGTIRRKFIFDTYQKRPAAELFIATMAWGSGPDNRGPAKAGGILKQPQADAKIEDSVNAARQDGAAAGYKAYYARNRLQNLDAAFVTKLLYFAGYRSPHRPRPLIFDSLVAAAAARFPGAPLLPLIADGVTTSSYQRYCAWGENIAAEHQTEPAVIEWTLFTLGAAIRDELRQ
jgi:8-oxoguanine DNA glycosylase-like protein